MRKRRGAEILAALAAGNLLKQQKNRLVGLFGISKRRVQITPPMHPAEFRGIVARRRGRHEWNGAQCQDHHHRGALEWMVHGRSTFDVGRVFILMLKNGP